MIDSALGRNTMFTFSWTADNNPLAITIKDKNKEVKAKNSGSTAAYRCNGQCAVGTLKRICSNF